jgi:hypothetical protein
MQKLSKKQFKNHKKKAQSSQAKAIKSSDHKQ